MSYETFHKYTLSVWIGINLERPYDSDPKANIVIDEKKFNALKTADQNSYLRSEVKEWLDYLISKDDEKVNKYILNNIKDVEDGRFVIVHYNFSTATGGIDREIEISNWLCRN